MRWKRILRGAGGYGNSATYDRRLHGRLPIYCKRRPVSGDLIARASSLSFASPSASSIMERERRLLGSLLGTREGVQGGYVIRTCNFGRFARQACFQCPPLHGTKCALHLAALSHLLRAKNKTATLFSVYKSRCLRITSKRGGARGEGVLGTRS